MLKLSKSELVSQLKVVEAFRVRELLVNLLCVLIKEMALLVGAGLIAVQNTLHKFNRYDFLNRVKCELLFHRRAQQTREQHKLLFLFNFLFIIVD